jgi:hypothetical protein
MKQPRKLKKQPDLKKRLDAVRTVPEPDVSFTVTLPASVYRSLEVLAGGNVPAWVAQMLVEADESGLLDEDGAGETD